MPLVSFLTYKLDYTTITTTTCAVVRKLFDACKAAVSQSVIFTALIMAPRAGTVSHEEIIVFNLGVKDKEILVATTLFSILSCLNLGRENNMMMCVFTNNKLCSDAVKARVCVSFLSECDTAAWSASAETVAT